MTTEAHIAAPVPSRYRLAVFVVLASSVITSWGGLIMRSLEAADTWQVILYRGVGLWVMLMLIVVIQSRGRLIPEFQRIGRWGLVGAVFLSGTQFSYIVALSYTTVANTLLLLAATPFITAILGWLLLRERVHRSTLIAIVVAFLGIGVLVSGGLTPGTMLGNAAAFGTALGFAFTVVILRWGRTANMIPMVVLAGLFTSVSAFLASGGDIEVSLHDAVLCLFWGGGTSAFGYVLFLFGSRHVTGAELTLLIMIEVILGPLWVWLFVNEVPAPESLIGGAIILVAVAGRALMAMRQSDEPVPSALR